MLYFSKEWYKNISVSSINEAECRYLERIKHEDTAQLRRTLNLHDERIQQVLQKENTLILLFKSNPLGANIKQLSFPNARIKVNDGLEEGDVWLYKEIYRKKSGYELHVLFSNNEGDLKELIFLTSDVFPEFDEAKVAIQAEMDTLWTKMKNEPNPIAQEKLYQQFLSLKKRLLSTTGID